MRGGFAGGENAARCGGSSGEVAPKRKCDREYFLEATMRLAH